MKQTQNSWGIIGMISGGVALAAFLILLVIGKFSFSPALFLAFLVGIAVAIYLMFAFHPTSDPAEDLARGTAKARGTEAAKDTAPVAPAPAPTPEPAPEPEPMVAEPVSAPDPEPAPALEPEPEPETSTDEAMPSDDDKPATLSAAREGGPDDLKRIKGVGPKMETMLHGLGFFHFDQVAAWTDREVAWVDHNLEGFKGRVSRDNWVEQAKLLATGAETEFSKKVDKGDVY